MQIKAFIRKPASAWRRRLVSVKCAKCAMNKMHFMSIKPRRNEEKNERINMGISGVRQNQK